MAGIADLRVDDTGAYIGPTVKMVAGNLLMDGAGLYKKGADMASASTLNLANATGDYIKVTGTTTIAALGTLAAGAHRILEFAGILIITHNATSLICPNGQNITTLAGGIGICRSLGSGNWKVIDYLDQPCGANADVLFQSVIRTGSGGEFFLTSDGIGSKTKIGCGADSDVTAATSFLTPTTATSPQFVLNDNTYNTANTSATTGTMSVTMPTTVSANRLITPTGDCTFNASGGKTGAHCTFIVTTSGTSSFNLTFGTNFKSQGVLATGTVTAKVFSVTFVCKDGTTWVEESRTTAM